MCCSYIAHTHTHRDGLAHKLLVRRKAPIDRTDFTSSLCVTVCPFMHAHTKVVVCLWVEENSQRLWLRRWWRRRRHDTNRPASQSKLTEKPANTPDRHTHTSQVKLPTNKTANDDDDRLCNYDEMLRQKRHQQNDDTTQHDTKLRQWWCCCCFCCWGWRRWWWVKQQQPHLGYLYTSMTMTKRTFAGLKFGGIPSMPRTSTTTTKAPKQF